LYPEGKNCAVPVLHRDYFVAKDEAQWPALRQVTPTKFYCRAVIGNCANPMQHSLTILRNVICGKINIFVLKLYHHVR